MKNLELQLKERLLIVEYETEAELAIDWALMQAFNNPKIIKFGLTLKPICKGSELTKEVADDLVDIFDLSYYVDYNGHNPRSYVLTALGSFKSAIEAQGYYWKKHPFGKLEGCCSGAGCGCMGMPVNVGSREEMDEILEAESRTFNPEKTLIFKILS